MFGWIVQNVSIEKTISIFLRPIIPTNGHLFFFDDFRCMAHSVSWGRPIGPGGDGARHVRPTGCVGFWAMRKKLQGKWWWWWCWCWWWWWWRRHWNHEALVHSRGCCCCSLIHCRCGRVSSDILNFERLILDANGEGWAWAILTELFTFWRCCEPNSWCKPCMCAWPRKVGPRF